MSAVITTLFKAFKRLFAALALIVLSLVLADLALHAAAALSPRVAQLTRAVEAKVPDATLGYRPNPAYPGHDARGFRNPADITRAEIVALGDSQTYGSGVASEHAWPSVLREQSGRAVYSMALGGYGPAHSLLLWSEAMELQPEIVIEALYAGNDLYDAFTLVYLHNKARDLRHPDPARVDAILAEEKVEPLNQRVSRLYRRGRVRTTRGRTLRAWLEANSRIVGLLYRLQYELKQWRDASEREPTEDEKWRKSLAFADRYPDFVQAFESPAARTLFTSEYRLAALEIDDPRIAEGKRIAFESLRRMQALAERGSVRFIVLLIPTKELVFARLAEDLDAGSYRELIDYERAFWEETRRFLELHSIEYIDGLEPLRRQLATGPQPYWVSHNGHPNETGQRALAGAVRDYLEGR